MSTVRAETLSNIAGTNSPTITGGELSRARFNLNGTGVIAARDSFNVSSFTDNAAGDYTANYTTAFPNGDYSVVGIAITPGTSGYAFGAPNSNVVNQATASVRMLSYGFSPQTATDVSVLQAIIVGDKA